MADKYELLFLVKARLSQLREIEASLEADCKGELESERERLGLTKMERRSALFGEGAGYMGFQRRKGKPSETVTKVTVIDRDKVIGWIDSEEPDTTGFALANLDEFCKWHICTTGEQIPGALFESYETEAVPDKWVPVVKVNSDVVNDAVENGLVSSDEIRACLELIDMPRLGE